MGERRGVLFLVVGPSGVGKDSVLDGARAALAADHGFLFPRRTITRPADAGGELHDAMTPQAFEAAEAAGAFCLSWRAHGLAYGIPRAVADALAAGRSVVVNVSRTVIDQARRELAPVRVLAITASPEALAARLRGRGRESEDEIARRLARAAAFAVAGEDVITLSNDGALADTVAACVALLRREADAATSCHAGSQAPDSLS